MDETESELVVITSDVHVMLALSELDDEYNIAMKSPPITNFWIKRLEVTYFKKIQLAQ